MTYRFFVNLVFVPLLVLQLQGCGYPEFEPLPSTEHNPGATQPALGSSAASQTDTAGLPDTPEQRAMLVERYFKAISFSEVQRDIVAEMSSTMPAENKAQFLDTMSNKVRWDQIEQAAKTSLARHMTVAELSAFIEFVERPEGKSALLKMRYYMADLGPVVQQEVFRAVAAN